MVVGCGGTFDFVSGRIKRAPRVIQKVGLEGIWRLLSEPKLFRLKRVLVSLKFFQFSTIIISQKHFIFVEIMLLVMSVVTGMAVLTVQ